VRAVSEGYPLRGRLKVSDTLNGSAYETTTLPKLGEIWVDPRLLSRLNGQVGTELQVGKRQLKVSKVLTYRPDQGTQFVELAPTVLMRIEDVASTGLVGLGSRIQYRQLFAGERSAIAEFQASIKRQLPSNVRMEQLGDASPQLNSSIERAAQFLNLSALTSILLASVAVAMAARRYVARHLDTVALMKSMGASQNLVLAICGIELLMLGLFAAIIGTAMGYVAQAGIAIVARDLLKESLPLPSLVPVLLGMTMPLVILAGVSLPPLLELKKTPPGRVLRHDVSPPPLRYGVVYVLALSALLVLLAITLKDVRLVIYVSLGVVATAGILWIAGWVLVKSLSIFRGMVGVSWRYGIANIARRGRESIVQLVAFGVGLMILLLLSVVRSDLLNDWRMSLPEKAPNQFLINISPDQATSLQQFFVDRGIDKPNLVPMLRARIVSINGKSIQGRVAKGDRGRGFLQRETNLTWANELQEGNKIIAGRWWQVGDGGGARVSVESSIAEDLELKLGDVVRYEVAGTPIDATISSIREVRWDSLRPNFFMVFSPGVLESFLGTYITSVYLDSNQREVMGEFYRQFPEVSAIDIDSVLTQVRSVMDNATKAIEYVFVFTLLAGITVLLAAIQATREQRCYESAMLRALGASRSVVFQGLVAEFIVLGLLAGLLGACGASAIGYYLATEIFNFKYTFNVDVWWVGTLSGVILVGLTGLAVTRNVVNIPPVATLRNSRV
jgi:putative ABC transport system permease protein